MSVNLTGGAAPQEIMRAVAQRVRRAKVTVDDEVVGEIKQGLVVLLGIARDDAILLDSHRQF